MNLPGDKPSEASAKNNWKNQIALNDMIAVSIFITVVKAKGIGSF